MNYAESISIDAEPTKGEVAPVDRALTDLHEDIGRTAELVAVLGKRLQGVLRPVPESDSEDRAVGQVRQIASPVANSLGDALDRLSSIRRNVEALLNRIEV